MATSAEHHAMNSGIPAVHVEDTTRNDDQSNPLNNLEFFKKINALLDNTLDLSALGLANITLPQGDKGLVAGQVGAQSHYDVVNNAQIPLTGIDLYNSNQTDPALTYSACNPTSYNTALATGVQTNASYNTAISSGALNNPYSNSCSGMNSVYTANQHLNNNFAPQSSAGGSAQTYNPAPGGLPQPYLAALTQLLLSGLAQQAPTHHQPPPSHPPGFVSQPQDQYSQHSQYNPYLQQQSELQSSFIPGAISNRTLEQLTESSMRPYRAIKAATDKHSYPSSESTGLTQTSNNVGTIGDRGYSGERHTSPDGKGNSRSSSPADSDSSGFSSGSDSFSDAALADLMNSLSIPTNPTQTAQTQAGLQNLQQPLQQQYQQAQQNYGQQTYNQQPPSQQYNFGQNQSLFQQQPNAFAQQAQALQSQLQQSQLQQTQLQQSQLQQNQYTAAAALAAQASAQQPQIDIMKVLGEYYLQNDALKRTQHQPMLNDFSLSAELFNPRTNVATNTLSNLLAANSNNDPHAIERAAKLYRNAATVCEPNCTWSGQLPPKVHKNPVYSCKVFLGGVPWDITEVGLQNSFKSYGSMKIEWPGKDGMHPRYIPKAKSLPAGYVYVLFESEKSVKALLQACTHDFSNGGEYYYRISSRRMRSKEVQVIPWVMSDSNFVKQASQRLDPTKTVFVGALHGMMNAEGLAHIMNDLFGNVVYAGIDTDKHKYPIGSGRVTFSSHKSYMKAVNAAFVEVKTPKFTKKIQIDPYLEDSMCQFCNIQQGPFFCRDLSCFRYYCKSCWQCRHALDDRSHKPLMRNNKGNGSNQAMVTSV